MPFIVLEGPEGAGKTTLAKAVARRLAPGFGASPRRPGKSTIHDGKDLKGPPIVLTREPGGSTEAEAHRDSFLQAVRDDPEDVARHLEILLQARLSHLKGVIVPALKAGRFVVCDRFRMSTLVYQGDLGGLSDEAIIQAEERILKEYRRYVPDIVFLLLPIDGVPTGGELRRRALNREDGAVSYFDDRPADFHRELQKAYRKRANAGRAAGERVIDLDANASVTDNLDIALRELFDLYDSPLQG